MSQSPDAPYRLGRAERRGAVLGLRVGQALAAALGATVLVVGVGTQSVAGAVLGVVAALAAVVVVTVTVAGRGVDEWVPVVVAHLVRVRGGALSAGASVQPATADGGPAHLRWPDGTATVVVALEHRGLRSLSDEPREFAEAVAAWLRGLGAVGAARWTVTLLTTTGPARAPRVAPWMDPGVRVDARLAVSAPEPVPLAEALAAAGVHGAVALTADELDEVLAARIAPSMGTVLTCDMGARWHALEGPATVHAAFVVEEWPSGCVDEQALAPLCVSRDRRTVAVAIGVEELSRARARTARVRTAAAADEAMVTSGGFLASPQSGRDADLDEARAHELAAGHGSVRLVCTVGLDAGDLLGLEAAAARLLADATSCGVRLRRCDGDHRRGVLATVPGWCVP